MGGNYDNDRNDNDNQLYCNLNNGVKLKDNWQVSPLADNKNDKSC